MANRANKPTVSDVVAKLPQRARNYIADLERKVEHLQKELADEKGGYPDSPVTRSEGLREYVGLPARTAIRFRVGEQKRENGEPKHWIEIASRDGRVYVMASTSLIVFSQSSNVLTLDLADRFELNEDVPRRNLGQRLIEELVARGYDWNDGLNIIRAADEATVKKLRKGY